MADRSVPAEAPNLRRRFLNVSIMACRACDGRGRDDWGSCPSCDGAGELRCVDELVEPDAVEDREYFAAQGDRLVRAEQLAMEVARRIAPWEPGTQAPTPTTLLRDGAPWKAAGLPFTVLWTRASGPDLRRAPPWYHIEQLLSVELGEVSPHVEQSAYLQLAERAFDDAGRRGVVVPEVVMSIAWTKDRAAIGRSLAELPNPYRPAREISQLGYALGSCGSTRALLRAPR